MYQTFGDKPALQAAKKIGDLLAATFGTGEGQRDIIGAGEHVGMAATSVLEPIVLLYQATREPRYLHLARYIVQAYDQPHGPKIVATLNKVHQVHKTANGKAYEMMSNLVGLCELYRATGDAALLKACQFAHDDIVANEMYLTGGTSLGEHFPSPHHLPNVGAVSENCAHVTWLQLCAQLLRLTGEARYADTLERIVYNHLLASQKPTGESLCYFTPLQGKKPFDRGMNCCTSSGPRGIALVTTFAYTSTPQSLTVNFYEASRFTATLQGVKTRVVQQTRYPLDGKVELSIEPERPLSFELRLRIPAWCKCYKAAVNDKAVETRAEPGTYLTLARSWHSGDKVTLEFDMPALLVKGDQTNAGLVAVQRGPLVLAFDTALNPKLSPLGIAPVVQADGTVSLSVNADSTRTAAYSFTGEGLTAAIEDDKIVQKKVPLVLTSFAEAGGSGSSMAVWMPSPQRLQRALQAPFLFGKESYSQAGNVEGSIADGDPSTFRVTFNGKKQTEAWFAVERSQPVTINCVVYTHGKSFHDGGWFDASQGKPRLQVKDTAKGAWRDVAVIDGYPTTTATDNQHIPDFKEFRIKITPVEAVAVRVIGTPAGGDNPRQSFASCAELQAFQEK